MGLSLRQKGLVVLALAFVVQLAVLWASVRGHVRHVAAQRQAVHTLSVVNQAQAVLTALVEAETGVRGFLIAGTDDFLQPYVRARSELPVRVDELAALTRRDPTQSARVERIRRTAAELIGWQEQTIALARDGSTRDTALDHAEAGRRRMTTVREDVTALLDQEQRQLAAMQVSLGSEEERLTELLIAGSLVSVVVLMGLLFAFHRGIGRRLALMITNMQRFADGEPLIGEVRGSDEIAQLDRALRQMTAELTSRRLARMQALSETAGLATSAQRSRDELLQATGERARAVLAAQHAEIWLPDPEAGDELGLRRLPPPPIPVPASEQEPPLICPLALRARLQHASGTARISEGSVSWLAAPFLNPAGRAHGVLAVARTAGSSFSDEDGHVLAQLAQIASAIFEIRRAYDALEAHAEQLAHVNRDLAQKTQENELFVYSVSHDLRSPLVNLQGFSRELETAGDSLRRLLDEPGVSPVVRRLAGDMLDGDVAESIHFIRAAVERLSRIIDGLLKLSRAGRVEYRRDVVDLTATAQRAVNAAHVAIAERGVTVRVAPELGAVTGDGAGIEQVFTLLLDNALKYLDPQRPGWIEFGIPEEPPAPDLHVVFVRDNGLGIAPAYQDKVFQPLQRVHVDAAVGEGLGLTVVRRVLDRMGGHVWMESEEGRGSTFFVALPAPAAAGSDARGTAVAAPAAPVSEQGVRNAR